jgi:hypothetical protein
MRRHLRSYPLDKDLRRWRLFGDNNNPEGGTGIAASSFWATLMASLLPEKHNGSGTPTFTRATAAAHTDFEGIIRQVPAGAARFSGARYVRNRVVGSSENLLAAGWSTNGNGSASDATTVVFGAPASGYINAIGTQGSSHVWTIRFKIKGTAGKKVNVVMFDAATGTKGGGIQVVLTAAFIPYSFTVTLGAASETYQLLVSTNNYFALGAADGNHTFNWTEIQAENVTGQANQNPSEYVPALATANADSGAIGVRYFNTLNGNTVASNVVTEAQGAAIDSTQAAAAGGVTAKVVDAGGPLGYLAEGVRTNLALQSNAFTTTWLTAATPSITQNLVAPDGTTTGWTVTDSSAIATAEVYQTIGLTTGTTYTHSIYVAKTSGAQASYPILAAYNNAVTRAALVTIDTSNGVATIWTANTGKTIMTSSASIASANTSWWRVSLTFTTIASEPHYFDFTIAGTTNATQSTGILDVTAQGSAGISWAQTEAAAFASSYIPTTTVAVTRNADVLTYPSAGNISGTQGGAYFEGTGTTMGGVWYWAVNNGGQGINKLSATITSVAQQTDGTTTINSGVVNWSTLVKVASSWGSTQLVTANGAVPTSGAFDGDMNVAASFGVGNLPQGTNQPFGTTRNLRIYLQPFSAARLQTMTT